MENIEQEIVKLYKSGLCLKEVSERVSISVRKVTKVISEAGIMRPRIDAIRAKSQVISFKKKGTMLSQVIRDKISQSRLKKKES